MVLKTKLKIIILTFAAVIPIAVIVMINIPYNLNNALHFNESEQILISVIISRNEGGKPIHKAEHFTYEKGSIEFTAINKLLDEYSYYLTTARNINGYGNGRPMVTISIIDNNNSGLFLINSTGSNIIVNGTNYRMNKNKIEELIGKILDICEMQ